MYQSDCTEENTMNYRVLNQKTPQNINLKRKNDFASEIGSHTPTLTICPWTSMLTENIIAAWLNSFNFEIISSIETTPSRCAAGINMKKYHAVGFFHEKWHDLLNKLTNLTSFRVLWEIPRFILLFNCHGSVFCHFQSNYKNLKFFFKLSILLSLEPSVDYSLQQKSQSFSYSWKIKF